MQVLGEEVAYQRSAESRQAVANYGRLDDGEFEQARRGFVGTIPDAAIGTAWFGSLFTGRLIDNLTDTVAANPEQAIASGLNPGAVTPAFVANLPEPLNQGIVDSYADALAPALWFVVPVLAVALFAIWAALIVALALLSRAPGGGGRR